MREQVVNQSVMKSDSDGEENDDESKELKNQFLTCTIDGETIQMIERQTSKALARMG